MYKHILIATDGSDLANKGLEHGLALAKALDARVLVVSITDVWASGMAAAASPATIDDYHATMTASVSELLSDAAKTAEAAGVAHEIKHIENRYPADAIVETAQAEKCDAIVMASHGRRGLRKMILGSQTSEVLASSTVPVLVVR